MQRDRRNITVSWPDASGRECNRLTLPLRWLQVGAGALLFAILCAVILGSVAAHLQEETGTLHARFASLEKEHGLVSERLRQMEEEVLAAREALGWVRSEEAKIRSWLGLEEAEQAIAPTDPLGGKGSLGDEGLGAVAPEARSTEAETADGVAPRGLVAESRALAADLADLAVFVQEQKAGWDAVPAISPVDGDHWVSSGFGWRRSPFSDKREFHNGIDMAGHKGTPIVAAASGKVHRVFDDAALGKGLSIDHGNGIRTIYGHLAKVTVKQGQTVTRGQEVGKMGSSGKRSTGPHLHYALKVDGKYVNPRNYLLDRTRMGAVARR